MSYKPHYRTKSLHSILLDLGKAGGRFVPASLDHLSSHTATFTLLACHSSQ